MKGKTFEGHILGKIFISPTNCHVDKVASDVTHARQAAFFGGRVAVLVACSLDKQLSFVQCTWKSVTYSKPKLIVEPMNKMFLIYKVLCSLCNVCL